MRDQLLEMIQKNGILPPFPEIINKLREMIEDPNTGINDVARVIQADPVLAGRLIHLANSVFGGSGAFYATELTRALGRLGLKMAMDLAYSLKMPNLFQNTSVIDTRLFWRHSLALGIVSSKVAQTFEPNSTELSHAYLGGLMRKIGILLFSHLIPEEYGQFLEKMKVEFLEKQSQSTRSIGLINLEGFEEEHFGISNAELGAEFIKKWWSLAPEVIDYVQTRPTTIEIRLSHSIEIARYILCAERVPDGILDLSGNMSIDFVQQRFGFLPEKYKMMTSDLNEQLNVFV
jgi:HD-like signal output (HDOD) protein